MAVSPPVELKLVTGHIVEPVLLLLVFGSNPPSLLLKVNLMLFVPSLCHSNNGIASISVGAGFNILNSVSTTSPCIVYKECSGLNLYFTTEVAPSVIPDNALLFEALV